jgi:protein phosphatase PTC6
LFLCQKGRLDCRTLRVGIVSLCTGSLPTCSSSDTRVFLCSTKGGEAFPMTENHHADARVESIRLRRMMGGALTIDSFGESR